MAELRFVDVFVGGIAGADLQGVVTLFFGSFNLRNEVGSSVDDGRGKGHTLRGIYSRHFALCSKDEFHVVIGPLGGRGQRYFCVEWNIPQARFLCKKKGGAVLERRPILDIAVDF